MQALAGSADRMRTPLIQFPPMNTYPAAPVANPWPIRPFLLGLFLFVSGVLVGYKAHDAWSPSSSDSGGAFANLLGDSDDYSWGNPNSKVVMVEFADFECPYCQQWHQMVYPQIKAAYGDSIRYIYRDFPLQFHANAEPAAEAAHCAGAQGRYGDMFELLFQAPLGLDANARRAYAQRIGLDLSAFDACVKDNRFASEIQADLQSATAAGVSGTPAFFINGRLISGAQPFTVFQQAIEAAQSQ
jgi:protein-disulfide isomerase